MKYETLRKQKAGDVDTIRGRNLMYKNLVVTLYMKGHSVDQIRELAELQTGHRFQNQGVYSWIKDAITEWEKTKAHFVDNHKAIELEKVNRLEVQYWEGYELSKKIQKKKTRVKSPGKDIENGGKMTVAQVREEDKAAGAGNPKFLDGVQWCINKRCELLGIDEPKPETLINQQINNDNRVVDNRTIIHRRVVFNTRTTTSAPQTLPNEQD